MLSAFRRSTCVLIAALGWSAWASPGLAVPLAGRCAIRGAAAFGADSVDFLLPAAGGTGALTVDALAPLTGDFAAFGGATASLKDLTLSAPLPIAAFLTFPAHPDVSLTLTAIDGGVFLASQCGAAPAVGQTCTPTGSPYNLVNGSFGQSTLSLTLRGTARRISTGEDSSFLAVVTAQFGTTYQSMLAAAASGQVAAAISIDLVVVPVAP